MADATDELAESAESAQDSRAREEEEAASFYAPPREDKPPPDLAPQVSGISPGGLGFLTLLCTSPVTITISCMAMVLWYEITPKSSGFLSGLGEAIMAFLSSAALCGFAVMSGIALAVGLLGRARRVWGGGIAVIGLFATVTTVVCFLPERSTDTGYITRGLIGLGVQAVCLGINLLALRFAGRKWLPPADA
jgi:hypothetical protein